MDVRLASPEGAVRPRTAEVERLLRLRVHEKNVDVKVLHIG